jgi:hypothetical protein
VAANNDATLNIAVAAGLGVSAITTSTDTTAGVGGVKLTNGTGDGKDFEGVSLGTMSDIIAVLIKPTQSAVSLDFNSGGWSIDVVDQGGVFCWVNPAGYGSTGDLVVTAENVDCAVEITIFAQ